MAAREKYSLEDTNTNVLRLLCVKKRTLDSKKNDVLSLEYNSRLRSKFFSRRQLRERKENIGAALANVDEVV